MNENKENFDVVKNPAHYCKGRIYEPRKVIHDWDLNFNLGSAVKYIARAGRKKDAIEDLKKAIQYIEFELEEMESKNEELSKLKKENEDLLHKRAVANAGTKLIESGIAVDPTPILSPNPWYAPCCCYPNESK